MKLNSLMIGSESPDRLAGYYTKLFGKPQFENEGFTGWQIGNGWMMVGPHGDVKGKSKQPGRVIWNIESEDVPADFKKLKGAGATVVQEPYHPQGGNGGWIATLSDPDDNYFQLVSPMT